MSLIITSHLFIGIGCIVALVLTFYFVGKKSNDSIQEESKEADFDKYESGIDPYNSAESCPQEHPKTVAESFQKPPEKVSELPKFNKPQPVYLYTASKGENGQTVFGELLQEFKSLRDAERSTDLKRYKIKQSCNQKKIINSEGTKVVFSFNKIHKLQ